MINKLSLGHLTGSKKIISNHLFHDDVDAIERKRRTVGQMFFQPYESKEEFIYCARHTFTPMAFIVLMAKFNPAALIPALILTPLVIAGLSAFYAFVGGISQLCGAQVATEICFQRAISACQHLLDLVVLPLSALVMLTRGISTGLHAAGVVSAHEENYLQSVMS